jgi:hypothetical protein
MPVNSQGERYVYSDRYAILLLEDTPPLYPTNSYLSYVYMVPSTKDVIFKNGSGLQIRLLSVDSGYVYGCLGTLCDRMTEAERLELAPNLAALISLLTKN